MSQQCLNQVVERASEDELFRQQLADDPETALAGYDLTDEERGALLRGDATGSHDLGVDARISKWAGDGGSFGDNGPWS